MSIALTNPKVQNSPLAYIEGDDRRFIALELRQRKIRMLWSLDGESVTTMTHPQEIEVRDLKNDAAWYFIDATRTFNVGTLNVRHMLPAGVLSNARPVTGASSPAYSTINIGPSRRIWVGGIPDDLRVPELEPSQGLGVAVSQLYVDQRQLGLWHFTSSSGKCAGAMLGPQEVASSTNERNFNGNGYAVLQHTGRLNKVEFSLSLSFKTLDEDALIFLALDEKNVSNRVKTPIGFFLTHFYSSFRIDQYRLHSIKAVWCSVWITVMTHDLRSTPPNDTTQADGSLSKHPVNIVNLERTKVC